jgi:hypothetical protein
LDLIEELSADFCDIEVVQKAVARGLSQRFCFSGSERAPAREQASDPFDVVRIHEAGLLGLDFTPDVYAIGD